jgi:hypothetical protein
LLGMRDRLNDLVKNERNSPQSDRLSFGPPHVIPVSCWMIHPFS